MDIIDDVNYINFKVKIDVSMLCVAIVAWMHSERGEIQLVTQSGRAGTAKPARRVSKSRGGQPKFTIVWISLVPANSNQS